MQKKITSFIIVVNRSGPVSVVWSVPDHIRETFDPVSLHYTRVFPSLSLVTTLISCWPDHIAWVEICAFDSSYVRTYVRTVKATWFVSYCENVHTS